MRGVRLKLRPVQKEAVILLLSLCRCRHRVHELCLDQTVAALRLDLEPSTLMLLLDSRYTNSEFSEPLTVTAPSDSIIRRLLRLTHPAFAHSDEYSSEMVPSTFTSSSQRSRKCVPNFTVD